MNMAMFSQIYTSLASLTLYFVYMWSCGLVVKALVAHASDPGSIPGDSRFFTSFLP